VVRQWRREIVATRFGKFEKLGSGDDTDGVAANV
jgi:hypothetical protein